MTYPGRKQAKRATESVNANVREQRCSCGHKLLMKFVAGSVEKNDEQRAAHARPGPRRQFGVTLAQGTENEQPQNGVFRQVTAFAEDMVDSLDFILGHMREKPTQERLDEKRGMLIGPGIGRGRKNNRHPN